MCGIFGLVVADLNAFKKSYVSAAIGHLFTLSESRGKEAAGLSMMVDKSIMVYKVPIAASEMIRSSEYKAILDEALKPVSSTAKRPFAMIGHSRLVTNGLQGQAKNNQPVVKSGVVGIHNGIIVNDEALWKNHKDLHREAEVDTEVAMALARKYVDETGSTQEAFRKIFQELEGAASFAVMFEDRNEVVLSTNTGSLHICHDPETQMFLFTSERFIMEQMLKTPTMQGQFKTAVIRQIKPMTGASVQLDRLEVTPFDLKPTPSPESLPVKAPAMGGRFKIFDLTERHEQGIEKMRRCSRCILPETFPFIAFDQNGVCTFCQTYVPSPPLGIPELKKLLEPVRSKNGEPDCIVAFSGGRDSSHSLHVIKAELGMNPLAYTYDWGMVTDLARRNQARICGKLGVEHILISADIKTKRENIRKNVVAWMKRPELGMIPLFMAGDKQYFYHAHKLRQQTGIKYCFFAPNKYETTGFKTGFCGLDFSNSFYFKFSIGPKIQLASYYAKQYLLNPRYINSSLTDTAFSFYSSFFLAHDYLMFYDYLAWDEKEMMDLLRREYDWEVAGDTESTWRIGDGTAAFYNYIYYTVAGFSEHDTFFSNQIRDGRITRDRALAQAKQMNRPRYDSIREYAHIIGFDADMALRVIDSIPKLYAPRNSNPVQALLAAGPLGQGLVSERQA